MWVKRVNLVLCCAQLYYKTVHEASQRRHTEHDESVCDVRQWHLDHDLPACEEHTRR